MSILFCRIPSLFLVCPHYRKSVHIIEKQRFGVQGASGATAPACSSLPVWVRSRGMFVTIAVDWNLVGFRIFSDNRSSYTYVIGTVHLSHSRTYADIAAREKQIHLILVIQPTTSPLLTVVDCPGERYERTESNIGVSESTELPLTASLCWWRARIINSRRAPRMSAERAREKGERDRRSAPCARIYIRT